MSPGPAQAVCLPTSKYCEMGLVSRGLWLPAVLPAPLNLENMAGAGTAGSLTPLMLVLLLFPLPEEEKSDSRLNFILLPCVCQEEERGAAVRDSLRRARHSGDLWAQRERAVSK